jgi:hypothetical protein
VQLLNSISATRFQRNIAITVNPVAEFEGEIPNEIAEYGRNFCPQLYTGLAQYMCWSYYLALLSRLILFIRRTSIIEPPMDNDPPVSADVLVTINKIFRCFINASPMMLGIVGNHFSYSRTRKETQQRVKECMCLKKKNIGGSPMAQNLP